MNAGSVVTILFSLALAGGVAYIGNAWLERRLDNSLQESPALVSVVTAAKDMPVDTRLDKSFLRLSQMPPALVPAGAIQDLDDLLGKVLKEPVYAGEVISSNRLLGDAGVNVLSALLAPGKRAITVRVNDVSGVSGFLLPGSRVDVISTRRGSQARTVLQDIKILAVGQTLQAAGEGALPAKAVTLEVEPRQAEVLAEAADRGNVQLTLRNQSDRALVSTSRGNETRAAPVAATAIAESASGPVGVTVVRGGTARVQPDLSLPAGGSETSSSPQVVR